MKRMQTTKRVAATGHGFTLIELLIVLAILVLLASLVAPKLLGSREKANVDAAKTQIGMFKTTLEIYSLHMSGYPSSEQGLKALIERPSSNSRGGDPLAVDDEFGADEDLANLGVEDTGEELEEEGDGGNSSWQGPYIKSDKVPNDPWGSAYRYEFPGNNNKAGEPDIWSLGPDRKDNTGDDIASWSGKRNTGAGGDDSGSEGFDTGAEETADADGIDLGE